MEDSYFSERQGSAPSRDATDISKMFWEGFTALLDNRLNDGSLAENFPLNCEETPVPIGCNFSAIGRLLQAEIPSTRWPLDSSYLPDTMIALDVIEFFCRYVSAPTRKTEHPFYRHQHLMSFDRNEALYRYCTDVNRLFRRNSLNFELQGNCQIKQLGPIVLRESLNAAVFRSENPELNHLLEVAREKFQDPDQNVRKEAVEKLWDAWERLKTIEPGKDKKDMSASLLSKAIPEAEFRARVNAEAEALTAIGNDFTIRHTETYKAPLHDPEYLDYLFHRLFALIRLLLRRTGRGA